MNDIEEILVDHLRHRAGAIHPALRLEHVHAGRPASALQGRVRDGARAGARFAAPPAWLAVAAGAVAVAGAGAFALAVRSPNESPSSPTAPPGALPVSPGPTITDHWHEAYGFSVCGEWISPLRGALEMATEPGQQAYVATGLHSHDDGVIHIHPFGSAGTGVNATLGTFLQNYGVELTDDALRFPADQGGFTAPTTCDGEPAELRVVVWPAADDPTAFVTIREDLRAVPLLDGAAMTIAVAAPGAEIAPPPSAADLDALAAVDAGSVVEE